LLGGRAQQQRLEEGVEPGGRVVIAAPKALVVAQPVLKQKKKKIFNVKIYFSNQFNELKKFLIRKFIKNCLYFAIIFNN
jgi:hypothetical protein